MKDFERYEIPSQEFCDALDAWSTSIEFPAWMPEYDEYSRDFEYDIVAWHLGQGFVEPGPDKGRFAWWILERGVRKYILSNGQDPDEYILKDWKDIDWNKFV